MLRQLYYKLFYSEKALLKKKLNLINNIIDYLDLNNCEYSYVITPSADLILLNKFEQSYPISLIRGDKYGVKWVVYYNKFLELSPLSSYISAASTKHFLKVEETEMEMYFQREQLILLTGTKATEFLQTERIYNVNKVN